MVPGAAPSVASRKSSPLLGRQEVDGDALDLERDILTHGHEAVRVVMEGLGADQEIDVLGRARIAVGPHGEPTHHDVPHVRGGQCGGGQRHRFKHLGGDDIDQERRVRFRHATPSRTRDREMWSR